MKRFITINYWLLVIFGLNILIASQSPVIADCQPYSQLTSTIQTCPGKKLCIAENNVKFCCDEKNECNIAQLAPLAEVFCDEKGCKTALGNIPTDPVEFVKFILKFAIAMAGGLAFLLMLWGSFKILTSAGNPEKLQDGKDTLTSAIAGLLFIVFSVILLKIIGVDIFGLPEWSR